jgi:hypothetical protein
MMQGWLGGSRGRAPAAYSGRWPHIHFEVYPSLEAATTASGKLVYATDGYGQSLQHMAQTSLETDMVFSDGYQAFARGLRPSGRR